MIDVAYVTYKVDLDDPHADIDFDIPLLTDALNAVGLSVVVAAWDDPHIDWASASLVLVRSAWDYVPRRRQFLDWARGVSTSTRLENPFDVVLHNTDKVYLRALERQGVHIVPTSWVSDGASAESAITSVRARFGPAVVVKPTVSAGALDTIRTSEPTEASAQVYAILATGRTAMIQPYLESVEGEGETSIVFLDGEISHAVRKVPALTEGGHGDPSGLVALTPELRDTAVAIMNTADARGLLYARVDLVRDGRGALALMELELTEPTLFLPQAPHAATTLAMAILRRLR